jgi:hypothetical protein
MKSLRLQIGKRHQNRQSGHAVQEEFPKAGVAVDDDEIAEGREAEIQDADLPAGQADAKGQASQTEPRQQFFP